MNSSYVKKLVSQALAEDIGNGDITTLALVPAHHISTACIICKSNGVICGAPFAAQVFHSLNPRTTYKALVPDGTFVKAGTVIGHAKGLTRALLTGERVALNLMTHCSAIATQTYAFVKAVKGYKAEILDTRKTTPLLRAMERYAVKCGGGVNHRFDLSDMAMIKDNHCYFAEGQMDLVKAVDAIKKKYKTKVVLEVDSLKEFERALLTKADIILLDNMPVANVRKAVNLRNKSRSSVLLEASGGMNIKNVRQYASTGIDRISVGALTHTRLALDLSMDIKPSV